MGLFNFFKKKTAVSAPAPVPVTKETLPEDKDALMKQGISYWSAGDYASAVLCYEKLLTLPIKLGSDENFCKAIVRLAEWYADGKGCPQDLEKAKETYLVFVRCAFAAKGSYITDEAFKIFCSPFCNGPDDHRRILYAAAEGLVWQRDFSPRKPSENALYSFEILREMVHLSENGMKYVSGEEAVRDFLASLQDPEDEFWKKGWPERWKNMTSEELLSLTQDDQYIHIATYTVSVYVESVKTGVDFWAREFPHLPPYDEYKKQLVTRFYDKYGSMNAQEVLDSLYDDEAKWQATPSAERQAARESAAAKQKIANAEAAAARRAAKATEEAERLAEEERASHAEILHTFALLHNILDEDKAENDLSTMAALADFYQRKGNSRKALKYAIRFADLDYAQDPDDKGWEQNRSGVLRGEEHATYEMYRLYCLYHSSGPAKRNEGTLAAPYIRGVGLAFSAAYCDLLRARNKNKTQNHEDTFAKLFTQLYETGHEEEARKWAKKGIQCYDSEMCYLAATLYAKELYVDEEDAVEYLRRGSLGTSEYAKACKDALQDLRNEQMNAIRRQRKAEWAMQARQAEAYQKANDARMDELRRKMDSFERDIDLALTGSGHTVEERMLMGDVSTMDGIRHQLLRDMVEEQAKKQL